MSASLAVQRVRLHGRVPGPSPRAHAETLLASLAPQPGDHSVLFVRHLVLTGPDPDDARRRLSDLRRAAARPALGWVDPHAAAVLFADEAEALACLTAELLSGTAAARWWWRSRLPLTGGRPGSSVTAVWLREIRWLPAALAWLERRRPGDSVAAVAALSPDQAHAVLVALLAPTQEVPTPVIATDLDRSVAAAWAAAELEWAAAANHGPSAGPARWRELVPLSAVSLPHDSRAVLVAALVRATEPAAAAPSLLRFAASLSALVPGIAIEAPPLLPGPASERNRQHRPAASSVTRPEPPEVRTGRAEPRRPLVVELADPRPPANELLATRAEPHAPDADPPLVASDETDVDPWVGATPTRHASGLYLVNVMLRFADGDAGWDDLGRFARRVLRRRPGRRARARDPVWRMLAALSGEPRTAAPRAPEWFTNARTFLAEHDIPVTTFEQPGRVMLTRTHLDVIMDLEQIDLAARVAGLDHDPSWVPQLGRIIAFHFLEGQR